MPHIKVLPVNMSNKSISKAIQRGWRLAKQELHGRLDPDRLEAIACAARDRVKLLSYWNPNQLRHAAGTRIEAEVDAEAVRAVLGHSTSSTSQTYIHRDHRTVLELMSRLG
jgi:site-specific recombinase XerC